MLSPSGKLKIYYSYCESLGRDKRLNRIYKTSLNVLVKKNSSFRFSVHNADPKHKDVKTFLEKKTRITIRPVTFDFYTNIDFTISVLYYNSNSIKRIVSHYLNLMVGQHCFERRGKKKHWPSAN